MPTMAGPLPALAQDAPRIPRPAHSGYTARMNSSHSRRRARLPALPSFALSTLVCALALSGCGNKGPLVLSEDAEPAQAVAAPATAPADAAPAEATPLDVAPADEAATDAPADTPDPPSAHD